jgi:hypothetical protein
MTRLIHWRAAVAIGAIMAAAIFYSAPAGADPIDGLTPAEIAFANHGAGQGVCDIFDDYGLTASTALRAGQAVSKVSGFPLTPDSALIINYSVSTFCPKYWTTLAEIGREARTGATV